ncbi:MAG: hypothetical protein QM802_14960 [Agriterribacter sp.]
MKKIIALCMFVVVATCAFAKTTDVSERVLRAFRETFTTAQKVTWHENQDSYSVRFYQGSIRYIVYYNKEGSIINSMRFYMADQLPVNILKEIKRHYSKRTTLGVTEITSGEDVAYFVRMEDDNHWYTIKFDASGDAMEYEKLKKQE